MHLVSLYKMENVADIKFFTASIALYKGPTGILVVKCWHLTEIRNCAQFPLSSMTKIENCTLHNIKGNQCQLQTSTELPDRTNSFTQNTHTMCNNVITHLW